LGSGILSDVKIDWQETIGYVLIILAACFFGASASLGKSLMQNGVTTIMLMETRSLVTSIVLLPVLLVVGRKHLQFDRKDAGLFLLLGIPGIALVNASYYYAVKLLTVALAVFLQFTAPVLVFLYGWITGKERATQDKLFALLLSLAGTYLMVQLHGTGTGPISWIGILSALLSTLSYAFYVIVSHHLGTKYSPWTILFYGYLIAGLFWCVIQNPLETAQLLQQRQLWSGALLFSFLSTLIPFTLFLNGLRRVTPTGATIASTSETVSASLFAYLVLDEILTTGQIVGAVLIVSAIMILTLKKKRQVVFVAQTSGGKSSS
jgi:drug/metabolite transporter (DMT)-like permease